MLVMVDFAVIKVETSKEYVDFQVYSTVIISLPNFESYNVTHESFSNFQSKLFNELNNVFWNPCSWQLYVRTEKSDSCLRYVLRVTNTYMLKNVVQLENHINKLISSFNFKYTNKKRRLYSEEYITHKVQKISINI